LPAGLAAATTPKLFPITVEDLLGIVGHDFTLPLATSGY
jgi:hypothetical protein